MGYECGLVRVLYRLLNIFFIATNFFNTRMRLFFSGVARETHVYAERGNRKLKLDVYLPKDTSGPIPAIIYAHGGGWIVGWRKLIEPAFVCQVKRGYALISFTYSFTNQDHWPAQIHDTKAAIRWLRVNAEKFGIDAEKIVISGASAGGHLACVAGLSGNGKLEGELGHQAISSSVCGILAFYPPADLEAMMRQGYLARRRVRALIGGAPESRSEALNSATPMTHAHADAPPLYLMHGTRDHVVPYENAIALQRAIEASGGDVDLITLKGRAHADWRFNSPENMRGIEAFLDRVTGRSN